MTKHESLKNRIRESWGLWGIIITYFVRSRFNYVNRDILTISDIATNDLILSLVWLLLFIMVTSLRVYADTRRK
jgi:hypothetical protein